MKYNEGNNVGEGKMPLAPQRTAMLVSLTIKIVKTSFKKFLSSLLLPFVFIHILLFALLISLKVWAILTSHIVYEVFLLWFSYPSLFQYNHIINCKNLHYVNLFKENLM